MQHGTKLPVALIVHLSSFQIYFSLAVISKNLQSKGRTLTFYRYACLINLNHDSMHDPKLNGNIP